MSLQRLEMCIADHARVVEYVNEAIHAPSHKAEGVLGTLESVDHLVA
jgi:hypothetical protein